MPELHDYQKQAVDYIQQRKRAMLGLEMGLGKTCICLSALTPDRLPALVVGPKRVAENVWHVEGRKWRPDLTVKRAIGRPADRAAGLASDADIVVIGRDNLADAVPYASRFKTFIIDESSGYKSPKSQRFKTARRMIKQSGIENVWELTGTPVPNGLMGMWSQIYLLDEGARLGKTITGYRNRYFVPGRQLPTGVITQWDLRPKAEKNIHQKLEDVVLTMEAEGKIELPPVTYNNVTVPLPPKVRAAYKKMKKNLVADLEELGLDGEIHSADTAAVLSNRLSQMCAGFLYMDDADLRDSAYDVLHHEKIRAVREIYEGTGTPILVGYRYKAEFQLLMEEFGPLAHTLDEPDAQDRWNAGEFPVMIVHPDSAGMGLNLQEGGSTLVWTSVPWGLEPYQQLNSRVARQGQKNPVVIHHLISPFTVDEAIMLRQREKKSVQDALLEHLRSPI